MWHAAHRDLRGCLKRLVATQIAGTDALAHGELDLTLCGDAQRLEELSHRHVERFFGLCGCPHRTNYADAVTMPTRSSGGPRGAGVGGLLQGRQPSECRH